METPRYYSRYAQTTASRANLPHWSQNCACFATFRLADSLPKERLAAYAAEREVWMNAHPRPWTDAEEAEFEELFASRIQRWLDEGAGSCLLGNPRARRIVEAALLHFDGQRYSLYAFVIMPNHVHALFLPQVGFSVPQILQSWKSFTSKAIGRELGLRGTLWQKESWDRLVRNVEEFNRYRAYIRGNNPTLAYDVYSQMAGEAASPQRGSGVPAV